MAMTLNNFQKQKNNKRNILLMKVDSIVKILVL